MTLTNLKYPDINSTVAISHFVTSVRTENPRVQAQLFTNENAVHWVVLPFKGQKSADAVKRQLSDLSNKIDHTLQTGVQESQNMWRPQDVWAQATYN